VKLARSINSNAAKKSAIDYLGFKIPDEFVVGYG
jgi:hypoxanthine-guanine phosphoribosyltransferase